MKINAVCYERYDNTSSNYYLLQIFKSFRYFRYAMVKYLVAIRLGMAISGLSKRTEEGHIEVLNDSDFDSVARIYMQAFSNEPFNDKSITVDSVFDMITKARSRQGFIGLVFKTKNSGDIVGFIFGSRIQRKKALLLRIEGIAEDKTSYINAVAVDIRYRSLGIGRSLIQEYIRQALSLGTGYVVLNTHELGVRGVKEFYSSLGFGPITRANGELIRNPEREGNVHFAIDLRDTTASP
jgi:ribosomal protein S18 acetylase RimI-like enzyme